MKNWTVKVTNVLTGETRETWEPWTCCKSVAESRARAELFPEVKAGKWRFETTKEA